MDRIGQSLQSKLGGAPALSVSPTSRCNLACADCRNPGRASAGPDMEADLLGRVLAEARELGAGTVTVAGGEPLLAPGLVSAVERMPGLQFVIHTNGTLLDADLVARIAATGNVTVSFGVDGLGEQTDARRGEGVHSRVEEAAALCAGAGVPFGVRLTLTGGNAAVLEGDRFIDSWIERGASFAIIGLHSACGGCTDPASLPTPAERGTIAATIRRWKLGRPILVDDRCMDASSQGGCAAASRIVHVGCDGRIQPCQHMPFSTSTVREQGLGLALESDLFRQIRLNQPCDTNMLRPCMMVDHPDLVRTLADRCEAAPTCEGAVELLTDKRARSLADAFARDWCRVADALWQGPGWESGRSVQVAPGVRIDLWREHRERMDRARLVTAMRKATCQGYHPRHATRLELPAVPSLPPLAAA